MDEYHFIEIEDVMHFFNEEMKYSHQSGWVRDQFELEACIEAPKHSFNTEYLLDVYGMAAKYICTFAIRHPFSDGNKRMGAICAVVFLEANGIDYKEQYDCELAEVIYKYLRNEISEQEIRNHLIQNSK